MKNVLFTLALLIYFISFGQMTFNVNSTVFDSNKETFGKYYIINSQENQHDTTKTTLEAGAYIVFYANADKDNTALFMANVWPNNDSQSYGKTYNHKVFDKKDPLTGTVVTNTLFKWDYSNTYNSEKGSATAILEQNNSPNNGSFKMTIITSKSNMLVYKGNIAQNKEATTKP